MANFVGCKRCRLRDNDLAFKLGREQIAKDFNLITMMRDLRLARLGLKHLLGMNKYLNIKRMAKRKRLSIR